jgi:hypothetical protein
VNLVLVLDEDSFLAQLWSSSYSADFLATYAQSSADYDFIVNFCSEALISDSKNTVITEKASAVEALMQLQQLGHVPIDRRRLHHQQAFQLLNKVRLLHLTL